MATKAKLTQKTAVETNGHVTVASSVKIPIASIILSQLEPQLRRREHFKQEDLSELAESIRDKGLICPITVRLAPERIAENTVFQYELVAGERRLLATQLLGLTEIEGIIRDLSDEYAVEVQLHENLKRVNVEPLDEAFSYRFLLDKCHITEGGIHRPYTVADIAAKFAKTEELILRRLKLGDLVDEGKKDLASGKLPLAHAELIARFPEKAQKQLLKSNTYSWQGHPVPYKDLQNAVQNNIVRNLKVAPFNVADPSLHPTGLECGNCTERTGYSPKLFDGDIAKTDHCLNGSCFAAKTTAHLKSKRAELAAELPNKTKRPLSEVIQRVPLIRGGWGDKKPLGPGTYLNDATWDAKFKKVESKKACEFTELALYVETDKIGKTQYICRSPQCKVHKAKKQSSSSRDSDYTLQRKQDQFDVEVATAVAKDAIKIALPKYDGSNWIFNSDDGRRMILAVLIREAGYRAREIIGLTDLPKEVKECISLYQNSEIWKAIEKLTPDQESQLLAIFAYTSITAEAVKKLVADQGLDYKLADAQARVNLAPKEKQLAFIEYRDQVVQGKGPANPPTLYWPKAKKEVQAKPKAKSKAVAK